VGRAQWPQLKPMNSLTHMMNAMLGLKDNDKRDVVGTM
jgi:hypothetical protein